MRKCKLGNSIPGEFGILRGHFEIVRGDFTSTQITSNSNHDLIVCKFFGLETDLAATCQKNIPKWQCDLDLKVQMICREAQATIVRIGMILEVHRVRPQSFDFDPEFLQRRFPTSSESVSWKRKVKRRRLLSKALGQKASIFGNSRMNIYDTDKIKSLPKRPTVTTL